MQKSLYDIGVGSRDHGILHVSNFIVDTTIKHLVFPGITLPFTLVSYFVFATQTTVHDVVVSIENAAQIASTFNVYNMHEAVKHAWPKRLRIVGSTTGGETGPSKDLAEWDAE